VVLSILQDKELANDVLQEVFVKVWRQIDQYDPGKGRLFTWLVNISRNASIDTLRSKSYNAQKQIRELTETVYTAAGSINTETDKIGLRKIVNLLKEEHKVLIELAYFQGYTQDEISKLLNIPLGTVKTRLRSATYTVERFFKEVMDIKEYIQSGIIEQYVLGLATPAEVAELDSYCALNIRN
jgi:RNA polymerase sigma-70 factor (ECF subfamily)